MKRQIIHLLTIAAILLSSACSNPIEPVPELKQEFSFTFNSQHYLYPDDKLTNVTPESFAGRFSITLNMINVFGGEIYFDDEGCAYLAPDSYYISNNGACHLTSQENGHTVPIDATKVFTYQSGHLDVTLSNCQSFTEQSGVAQYTYTICLASGTFELTLANSLNQTIELTNGTITNLKVIRK